MFCQQNNDLNTLKNKTPKRRLKNFKTNRLKSINSSKTNVLHVLRRFIGCTYTFVCIGLKMA